MDLLQAIILGILQGATEFLPISSSGHLVLVPWWLGWDKAPLVFDVTLHLGTLVAVLVYFWRDWLTLLRAGWTALRTRSFQDPDARLLLYLVLGTIPAALAGLLFEDFFASVFEEPWAVSLFLLGTAAVLTASERAHAKSQPLSSITARDSLAIGLAQALAIFPGLSRSGSTIAAGMLCGLSRPAATRFSFLLAAPIVFGAGFKQVLDLLLGNESIARDMVTPMIAGFLASLVVGYLCIWFLLRLVQRRRLYGFALYCAVFGTLSLLVALFT